VGPHWGLYQQDCQVKSALSQILPPADPATCVQRTYRDIYVGGLEAGFTLGIDTFEHQFGWLFEQNATLRLAYPANQTFGVMFVTVGHPGPLGERHSLDMSAYDSLNFEMRTVGEGQCVGIGLKDAQQPDNGKEQIQQVCPSTAWTIYRIPLKQFALTDLSHLYTMFEVVFRGQTSTTLEVRNIRYSFSLR
jgi:hypothetical protein